MRDLFRPARVPIVRLEPASDSEPVADRQPRGVFGRCQPRCRRVDIDDARLSSAAPGVAWDG